MPSMPSWSPDETRTPDLIEANWLFRLVRAPFRSRATGKTHAYYIVELADAVHVVALTPARKLILVRQFRAGSGADSLEPPGGLLGPGEHPCEAAARELLEETGYAGDPPVLIGTSYSNPSILSSRIHTVLIENARAIAPPKPDPEEELRVELVPAGQIPWMIRDGSIDHALAVKGLLLWLASELPESPFRPDPESSSRVRLHLSTLMIAVVIAGAAFGIMARLGVVASVALAWALAIAFGPMLTLRYLDPPSKALLLRGRTLSVRHQVLRALAALGSAVLIFAAAAAITALLRF